MKSKITFLAAFFLFLNMVVAQVKTVSESQLNIGEIKTIQSKVLGERRTLNIYLPPTYTKDKAYPVLYLLDGSANEDFLHIVGLVQFYNMQFQMPDFIVVGVANVDRKRDFTFPTDAADLKKEFPTTGGSAKFINFIESELQPYIQSKYSTTETKFIIGQSLGGLLATEILLKKPQLFTHYLIVSPSLWWDNESLLKNAPSLLEQNKNRTAEVYLAVGMKEHVTMVKDAKDMSIAFRNAKNPKVRFDFMEMTNENHASILHQSINDIFKKMYPLKE
ncbi:MAG: alpha/beta hydrolase [Flavobacterium sp.]|nr:alpha/beta hydrolase [Flavobacterium sp.]